MKRKSASQSVQAIFTAFDTSGSDNASKNIRTLFKLSLYLIMAYPVGIVLEKSFGNGVIGQVGTILATAAAFGWFISVILTTLIGAQSYGKNKGSGNLALSLILVFRKTFKYVLLPAIITTALLIVWAIITKQPTFH